MTPDTEGFDAGAGNALTAVLEGGYAELVPVAPLFVDSPFRAYVDEHLYSRWEQVLTEAGADRMETHFEAYSDHRFTAVSEIIPAGCGCRGRRSDGRWRAARWRDRERV